MKRTSILLFLLCLTIGVFAQQEGRTDKKNTITIKVTKEIDGKMTVIDTTVSSDSDIDVEALMESIGVDGDVHESHDGEDHHFEFKFDDHEGGAHNVFKFRHDDDGEVSMDFEGLDEEAQAKIEEAMEKLKGLNMKFTDEDGETVEFDGSQFFQWNSADGEHHINLNLDGLGEEIEAELKKAFESVDFDGNSKGVFIQKNGTKIEVDHDGDIEVIDIDGMGEGMEMDDLDEETRAKLKKMGIEIEEGAKVFQFKSDGHDGKNVFIHKHVDGDADSHKKEVKEMQVRVTVDAEDDGKHVVKKMIRIAIQIEEISDTDKDLLRESGLELGSAQNGLAVNELSFYPNPSNGDFNLSFEAAETGDVAIRVINADGRRVYTEKLKNFSGRYDKKIDLTDEASGVYFLNISQNGKVMNKKLVVN